MTSCFAASARELHINIICLWMCLFQCTKVAICINAWEPESAKLWREIDGITTTRYILMTISKESRQSSATKSPTHTPSTHLIKTKKKIAHLRLCIAITTTYYSLPFAFFGTLHNFTCASSHKTTSKQRKLSRNQTYFRTFKQLYWAFYIQRTKWKHQVSVQWMTFRMQCSNVFKSNRIQSQALSDRCWVMWMDAQSAETASVCVTLILFRCPNKPIQAFSSKSTDIIPNNNQKPKVNTTKWFKLFICWFGGVSGKEIFFCTILCVLCGVREHFGACNWPRK